MLPGPVFNIELLTTARRARYYAARVTYGLVLLAVLWQTYEGLVGFRPNPSVISIRQMSQFAYKAFTNFAISQSIAVLLLTPTLLAGAIADEAQRKTLHYLLASRLTSGEVVLGKLAARLLHVLVFLAIGLPIISLMSLLGGIEPRWVILLDAATATTAFFLAGLSLLISTFARRVRDAIITVYLIEATWLIAPIVLQTFQFYWPKGHSYVNVVNQWLLAINPVWVVEVIDGVPGGRGYTAGEAIAWLCGLQVAIGSLLILFAVVRLRPAFRASGGESRRSGWSLRRRTRQVRRRPPVALSPMLWKERYVGRSGGLLRGVARVIGLVALAGVGYGLWYFGWPAVVEVYEYGYAWVVRGTRRDELNGYLRFILTMLSVAWLLGVGASAAAGVTAEREEDTWISLTSTTLTGSEILFAKMFGAAWTLRALGGTIVVLIAVGLLCGALHPFGALGTLLALTVFTWFVSSLGTLISLRSRTTTRAMAFTIVVLLVTNVGYMMCCIPLRLDSPIIAVGCMPFHVAYSLLSFRDVWMLLGFEQGWGMYSGPRGKDVPFTVAAGLAIYTVGALVLTIMSVRSFDRILDRPSLNRAISIPKRRAKPVPVEV
jgi:ABC-type transport system involved in multi-copper enzyme maturation permease subunit